ncbi:MAG: LamG domain-containing protein [Bryobacteraceae bacterium]
MALKRNGQVLFAADEVSGLIIVDLPNTSARSIRTDGAVHSLVLSPNEDRLFLAMAYKGLKVLDLPDERLRAVSGLVCPMNLALDAGHNLLWISCRCGGPGGRPGHDNIDVLDLLSERSVRTVGGPPIVGGHIAVSPDGALVAIDGGDACISPRYDRDGCPPGASGVVQVFRTADGKHLTTLLTSAPGYLHFAPDTSRLLHANGQHLTVFETSSFRRTESLQLNVLTFALSPRRREILALLREPHEWVGAPLPNAGCDFHPTGLNFMQWSADGVFTDLGGAGHGLPRDITFRPGILGQAFQFNGSTSFIDTPEGDFGFFLDANITYMLWLSPSRSGVEETIFQRIFPGQPSGWRALRREDDRIELEFPEANGRFLRLTSRDPVANGDWSHIALVARQDNIELFVNGNLQGSLPGRIRDRKGGRFRFGSGVDKNHFAGLMDEVTAQKGTLTIQQIANIGATLRHCEATNSP